MIRSKLLNVFIRLPLFFTAAIAILIGTSHTSVAQSDYPNKPIRFIVPFPAGGATDNIARPLQNLSLIHISEPTRRS